MTISADYLADVILYHHSALREAYVVCCSVLESTEEWEHRFDFPTDREDRIQFIVVKRNAAICAYIDIFPCGELIMDETRNMKRIVKLLQSYDFPFDFKPASDEVDELKEVLTRIALYRKENESTGNTSSFFDSQSIFSVSSEMKELVESTEILTMPISNIQEDDISKLADVLSMTALKTKHTQKIQKMITDLDGIAKDMRLRLLPQLKTRSNCIITRLSELDQEQYSCDPIFARILDKIFLRRRLKNEKNTRRSRVELRLYGMVEDLLDEIEPLVNRSTGRLMRTPCKFCLQNDHLMFSCPTYKTAVDRMRRCRSLNICVECLRVHPLKGSRCRLGTKKFCSSCEFKGLEFSHPPPLCKVRFPAYPS